MWQFFEFNEDKKPAQKAELKMDLVNGRLSFK